MYLPLSSVFPTGHTTTVVTPGLSAGLVGLTLTTAFGLLGVFQWTIRQSIEAENQVQYNKTET